MPDPRFYQKPQTISLQRIADFLGVSCPDEQKKISGVNSLEEATEEDIAVCFDKKSLASLQTTHAGVCLVTQEFLSYVPKGTTALCVKNPRLSFAKVGHFLYPNTKNINVREGKGESQIHSSALISSTAFIGKGVEIEENTVIGANAHIGDGVKIGKNCHIHDNVTLMKTIIGNHVAIHSGARIGSEGFGFVNEGREVVDIPHLGRVLIKDNVRIGANTTIDRGVLGDTLIEEYCRIDNLVQIAHNVHLGKGCIIVAQVGISGSTQVGSFSIVAGQAGVTGHLKIGERVTIAAQSGVMRDIQDGETVGGSPAVPIREWHRQVIYLSKVIKK
jgi:UDP-3-O-[3-hydroxymyristoyl] glucosamine N-acyltransferase